MVKCVGDQANKIFSHKELPFPYAHVCAHVCACVIEVISTRTLKKTHPLLKQCSSFIAEPTYAL